MTYRPSELAAVPSPLDAASTGRPSPELCLLKRERGVATFLRVDTASGARTILKTAPADRLGEGAQHRLEREIELLRGVDPTRLAAPLTAGREGDEAWVVRDYVDGITLSDRIRRGPLSPREAITVGRGVIGALAAAHDRGVLHRDVKPANVIVGTSEPLTDVTLVDFGFARDARLEADAGELTASAAHYVSLEQAGLLRQDADVRSDLYSAGVVLFECLAGHAPFTGTSVGEVLRGHATSRPPRLHTLGAQVPAALEELVRRLLRKDPRDRYQSADAVGSDLCAIGDALDRGDEDPQIVLGLHERRRRSLTEPALIARTTDLERLEAELGRATAGTPGLVLVEALSGGGKSRLLEELDRVSARSDAWVLRGQGRDQAAQRPFQVLDGVVRGVLGRCRSDPAFAAHLRGRLVGREAALVEAMPELLGILAPQTAQGRAVDEQHGEMRTIMALADLLQALGAPGRPAVVMLDDCQWADGLTCKLLAHWREADGGRPAPAHVMVVVAFRSEEVAEAHPLRALTASDRLRLAPLDDDAVRDLVESMAGAVPDDALQVVVRLAEGSPFMAAELLRGLVETGALVGTDDGWHTVPDRLASVQASSRSAAVFSRRLEQAPKELLHLLSVGALLGKQFEVDQAAELAECSADRALVLLADARRRHIVWPEGPGCFTFAHDKLREALLARLPEPTRRALHGMVAAGLEQRDGDRSFELSFSLRRRRRARTGAAVRAACRCHGPCALRAGRRAAPLRDRRRRSGRLGAAAEDRREPRRRRDAVRAVRRGPRALRRRA